MTKRLEMKKRFLAMLLIVCMVLTMMPTMAFAAGSSPVDIADSNVKSLESDKTYTIKDTAGLKKLAELVIPASGSDAPTGYTIKLTDGFSNTEPFTGIIGNSTYPFNGTFDGNNKTIQLAITGADNQYVGLFAQVGADGKVHNLLVSGTVSGGQGVATGGIAGSNAGSNAGSIKRCKNMANVSGNGDVGGIVGSTSTGLTKCVNAGVINGSTNVGGLAGSVTDGSVADCYNMGKEVIATASISNVGGIVGNFSSSGSIVQCYNAAEVKGVRHYIGGIVGTNSGNVANCIFLGSSLSFTDYQSNDPYQMGRIAGNGVADKHKGNKSRSDIYSNVIRLDLYDKNIESIAVATSTPQSTVFNQYITPSTWTTISGHMLNSLPTLAWEVGAVGPTLQGPPQITIGRIYRITFDRNGGNTDADPKEMTAGEIGTSAGVTLASLPKPPKKYNYQFAGWATTKDARKANFTIDTTVNDSLTLYAVWQPKAWEYFAFANSRQDFFTNESRRYYMNDDDWTTMMQNVDRLYAGSSNDTVRNLKNLLRRSRYEDQWGGSCYGMALSEGLLNSSLLDMEYFSPGETTLPTVPAPARDSEVRSNINFFHLTQMVDKLRSDQHWGCALERDPRNPKYWIATPSNRIEWKADLQELIDTVKQGPTMFCYYFPIAGNYQTDLDGNPLRDQKGNPILAIFGHAVILDGIKSTDGSTVILSARDNRYPGKNGTGITDLKVDLTGNGKITMMTPDRSEDIVGIEYTRNFANFAKNMPLGKATDPQEPDPFVGMGNFGGFGGFGGFGSSSSFLLVKTPSGNSASTDGTPPMPPGMTNGIQISIDGGNTRALMIMGNTADGEATSLQALYGTDGKHDVQIATMPGAPVQATYTAQTGTSSLAGAAGADGGATTLQNNGAVTGTNLSGEFTASVQSGDELISVTGTTTGQPFTLTPSTNGNATLTGEGGTYTVTRFNMNNNQQTASMVTIPAGGGTAMLQANGKNGTASMATLSIALLDQLIANKTALFTVKCNPLTLTFDLEALRELRSQSSEDIIIEVTPQDVKKLSQEAQVAIGDRPAFDITIRTQDYGKMVNITNFGKAHMGIHLPYAKTAAEQAGNLLGVSVNDTGAVSYLINSNYNEKTQVLSVGTNHCSIYGIGYQEAPLFTDIANHWAKDDITFVATRGLLSGTADKIFSPDMAMTRGMFVTTLSRLAGADVSSYKQSSFSDVSADAYYMSAVEWAAKNGIVSGLGDKLFAPDQSITREQMAAIMVNYAKVMGYAVPQLTAPMTFADNASIGSWAKTSVDTMQMASVLGGKAGNIFDPTGTATRAEVAAVLHRYLASVLR